MDSGTAGNDAPLLDPNGARVFLCLFYDHSRLGIAYYDEETGTLHISETWESEDFANVQLIKMQVNPSMILVSSKASEEFMDAVTDKADSTFSFVVKVLLTKDFLLDNARSKIATLDLLGLPDNLTHPLDKLEYFASLLDFENTYMIRATGALINFLQRNLTSQLKVNNVVSISSENYMFVDTYTLHSLQIFSTERHPSLLGKGKAKEGMSLFGIMDHTKSTAGKRLLREWFLRPTVKVSVIEARQEAISFFIEGSMSSFITELQTQLKQISDLSNIVLRIRRASASIKDWENVLKSASRAWDIRRLCNSNEEMEELQVYTKMMTVVDGNIQRIAELLEDVIDFEDSKNSERIVIQHGVDEELDEAKQQYSFLDEYLTEVGKEEMQFIEGLDNIRIIYYPQIGFLISIPNVDDRTVKAKVNRYNWNFQYETEESLFFKNERMYELDDTIGDIHNTIADIELAIARELEIKILEYAQQLIEVTQVCAELDCILSLAITAREHNYVRPNITEENVIYISNGRHPLQELCVDGNFIPNDTAIAANREGSVKLITGPNYSGKSVYLKQVGLITYMAHVGSFVPADGAVIGMCDNLFTRIHTRETASLAQSSFMIDCHQVALMTRHTTERSLLLIDEFGKGTNPDDGTALFYGAIEYLLNKVDCPKVLVTTHFVLAVELLRQNERPNLEFVTLDFIAQDETIDEITFLYRLVGGVSDASYGMQCCESAGMAPEVVKRSKYVKSRIMKSFQISPIEQFEDIEGDTRTLVDSFLSFNFATTNPQQFMSLLSNTAQNRSKRKTSEKFENEKESFQHIRSTKQTNSNSNSNSLFVPSHNTAIQHTFSRYGQNRKRRQRSSLEGRIDQKMEEEVDSERETPKTRKQRTLRNAPSKKRIVTPTLFEENENGEKVDDEEIEGEMYHKDSASEDSGFGAAGKKIRIFTDDYKENENNGEREEPKTPIFRQRLFTPPAERNNRTFRQIDDDNDDSRTPDTPNSNSRNSPFSPQSTPTPRTLFRRTEDSKEKQEVKMKKEITKLQKENQDEKKADGR